MNGKFFAVEPIKGNIIYTDEMKDQENGYFNMTSLNTQIVPQKKSFFNETEEQILQQPEAQKICYNSQSDFTPLPCSSTTSPLKSSDTKDLIFTSLNLYVSAFQKLVGIMVWRTCVKKNKKKFYFLIS